MRPVDALGSLRPVSLRHWLWRYTRLPLFFIFVLFLAVEGLFLFLAAKNQFSHQTAIAARLAQISELAIAEKSTSLLQAGFELAVKELGAVNAFVCEQMTIYVLVKPALSPCWVLPRWNYRVIETPLGKSKHTSWGEKRYSYILQVPVFPQEQRILLSLGLSFILSLLGLGLVNRLRVKLEGELFYPMLNGLFGESPFAIAELENLRARLKELTHLKTQSAVTQAVLEKSAQVAHDIQSPLTVLLFSLQQLNGLSKEVRESIHSSVKRISAITEDLFPRSERKEDVKELNHLIRVLKEIIEEKKVEYRSLDCVSWDLNLNELSEETYLENMTTHDLKRVLSNLLNNSVEALVDHAGQIELGARLVQEERERIEIWVRDNGRGFPKDFKTEFISKGYSSGKAKGRGLGLKSAKEFVAAHQGELIISSSEFVQTTVMLVFPKNLAEGARSEL